MYIVNIIIHKFFTINISSYRLSNLRVEYVYFGVFPTRTRPSGFSTPRIRKLFAERSPGGRRPACGRPRRAPEFFCKDFVYNKLYKLHVSRNTPPIRINRCFKNAYFEIYEVSNVIFGGVYIVKVF